MLVLRKAAESPAGRHHRPGVVGDGQLADLVGGTQATIRTTGILGRFGGVFRQISRDPDIGAFAFGIRPYRANVELTTPANHKGRAVWSLGPQPCLCRRFGDDLCQ
jgi:hypothetical protein